MAEQRPGGEATEPPSEKKLRQARKRGEVVRSREVVSVSVFVVTAATIAWTWPSAVQRLRMALSNTLAAAPRGELSVTDALSSTLPLLGGVIAPVLAAAFVAALVSNYAQVRGLLTLHPIKPQLRRIDPFSNAKQMFGKRALGELLKSLVKVVGICFVAASALWQQAPILLGSLGAPPEKLLRVTADCLATLAAQVGVLVILLAAIDYVWQRHSFIKKQRMTKQEVQREQKDSEGDPHHKAERQRLQREVVEHLMVEAVATADCVVINPTRLAVALRYDANEMGAPKVVARGHRLMAARIREIARQHGVPIVRDVPLARALVELEEDSEIPDELYDAVATILRFVYKLTGEADEPAE